MVFFKVVVAFIDYAASFFFLSRAQDDAAFIFHLAYVNLPIQLKEEPIIHALNFCIYLNDAG